ncbi:hypothetical protein HYV86_01250 [Candidatus Woesearchaeota archaeon]|nr:hypothetical protein [Candidatus Woesearchaeota archaeon]
MDASILEKIGLTKNEAKLYLALLEMGCTAAGPLIKRMGMHRALVYELLDLLIQKGIVSYVIAANRKLFQAEDPQRLVEFVTSKKDELTDQEQQLEKLLPSLRAHRKLAAQDQEGSVYKGKKGIKAVFEDMLRIKKPWHVFGATGQFKEYFGPYFLNLHKRRSIQNIPLKIIFRESVRSQQREKELAKAQIRYLPVKYLTPSTTFVYGDTVAILIWDVEPMAFVIRSKSVAQSYLAFFEILWENARG